VIDGCADESLGNAICKTDWRLHAVSINRVGVAEQARSRSFARPWTHRRQARASARPAPVDPAIARACAVRSRRQSDWTRRSALARSQCSAVARRSFRHRGPAMVLAQNFAESLACAGSASASSASRLDIRHVAHRGVALSCGERTRTSGDNCKRVSRASAAEKRRADFDDQSILILTLRGLPTRSDMRLSAPVLVPGARIMSRANTGSALAR